MKNLIQLRMLEHAMHASALFAACALACAAPPTSVEDSSSDSGVDTSSSSTEPDTVGMCDQRPLSEYTDNGCAEGEDRVTFERFETVMPEAEIPDGEEMGWHWQWSCVVEAVEMSPTCDRVDVTMTCDDEGTARAVQQRIESTPGAALALTQGTAVEYELEAFAIEECCGWSTWRLVDAEGPVVVWTRMHGRREDAFADAFITTALEDFGGIRTPPACTADLEDTTVEERAIELTIDGEQATVAHDSAADVGRYRVLVGDLGSSDTIDFGVSQFNDVLIVRTAPSP